MEDDVKDVVQITNEGTEQVKKHALTPEMEAHKWKPGQSGNPGGRQKDILTPLLREFLNADNELEKREVVKQLIGIAKSSGQRGQVAALKEIFDRIDGRVPDTHKIESDLPVNIVLKLVKPREE